MRIINRSAMRLSVVLLYDQPCDARSLDEALFSLAIQDHTPIEVVVVLPACGRTLPRRIEQAMQAQPWPEQTRAQIVSVPTRTSPQISASPAEPNTATDVVRNAPAISIADCAKRSGSHRLAPP